MAQAAQHQAPASAPKLIYRVHEATAALGVSVATIYRMCDRGELVKGKIGNTRSVGITAASINQMIDKITGTTLERCPSKSVKDAGC